MRKRGQRAKLHSPKAPPAEHLDIAQFGDYRPESIVLLNELGFLARCGNPIEKLRRERVNEHFLRAAAIILHGLPEAVARRDWQLFADIARRLRDPASPDEAADPLRYILAWYRDRFPKRAFTLPELRKIQEYELPYGSFDDRSIKRAWTQVGGTIKRCKAGRPRNPGN